PGHDTATSTRAGTSAVPSGSRKSSVIRCAPVAAQAVARTVTPAAAPRVPCTPDSTTGHSGFRCAP
ncbi:hypothetical protein ACFU8Q_41360, partial [Streptomyces sp. NPDC057543]|uniref:hypothetical protein n=1 Tax=Streptomyces sp. NPDC057543 TaxID=3346163 RepID=UPI0036C4B324